MGQRSAHHGPTLFSCPHAASQALPRLPAPAPLLTGVRLLPVFFHGFFMLTCPSSCLLTGAVATLLTANSSSYCSTRLLSHPLGRSRLAALATSLEFGSLPLLALQPTSRHLQPAGALMAGGCCGRCGLVRGGTSVGCYGCCGLVRGGLSGWVHVGCVHAVWKSMFYIRCGR